MTQKLKNINVRITTSMGNLIDRYLVANPTYLNQSEFARVAIRDKIKNETPWIYEEMMKSESKENS